MVLNHEVDPGWGQPVSIFGVGGWVGDDFLGRGGNRLNVCFVVV